MIEERILEAVVDIDEIGACGVVLAEGIEDG
jgi:hypothetical protein